MNRKTIQTILFIFFLFSYNLVKSEEPKLKLVKVKEFNSYEEYERWKGKVKKPSRIIVDKGIVRFCDEKGKVIREKKYRYMDEEEWKKICGEYEKNGKDIKGIEVYSENVKVLPNDRGILLIKGTDYYGSFVLSYEIYDEEGNLRGQIDGRPNEVLHPSPDGSYFVGIQSAEGWVDNVLRVYDGNGKIIYDDKVYDFNGMAYNITFSTDSKYAVITIIGEGEDNDGIIVYNRDENRTWKLFNKKWSIPYSGVVVFSKGIIIPTNKWVYRFSFDGKQIWFFNEKTKANYEGEKKVGSISVLSVSPDGKDIVGYAWPGIVYVIDTEIGRLIRKIELNIPIRYIPNLGFLVNRINYIFIGEGRKSTSRIYLLDKQGRVLWKKLENDLLVYAELTEDEELLIKDKEKFYLYKIQEER
jgi:hypothetical protein